LVLLFGIAFILLTETSLRASDGLFYMIKALGVMILVGTARKEYLFLGALLYVAVEYLLFIVGGLPISYKETLILVVILGVLLFKPEGLFTGKARKI
jgi:branched-subunit amino acid ABC-type transport system permease component